MRIPSPGPDLTGRRLAKEVPDDPNRTGSIYADQFLAHKCPAHFDEVQRRQFFCILDLRRLKYAADEIFAKKDWKLNILNFAKEYEKSRGLIMLRYGLYEFKNVKPSNEVLKKWRSAHGLPPGPEEGQTPSRQSRQTPAPPGSVKRKAEEDSVPKDNALMASTANRNKRRNIAQEVAGPILAVPASFKSKRKADETDEIDENKPSKQQKSTPSAATTFLENILNKSRNGGASPSKQSSQATSLFGISKTKDSQNASAANKANPFEPVNSSLLFGPPKANSAGTSSGSVLSGHKIGSTPENTGNIFRYLSASPSSSSDDEDDDVDDHKSQPEPEQNSEEQSPSAGITTNTSTPPVHDGSSAFVVDKTNNTSDIFGRLSKSTSQSARGGLFGRVQMGANGHPVRADPSLDKKQDAPVNQPSTTKEQAAKTPAQTPGDYTFNPATTLISFGQPAAFGQPAVNVSKSSGTKDTGHSANSDTSVAKKPVSIFDASSQLSSGPKVSAPSLFGMSSSTKPKAAEPPVSIFTPHKPTLTSASIFGATSTADTAKLPSKSNEQTNNAASTTEKRAVSIFDKPATSASATSETKSHPSNVDGKTASSTVATKSQVPSIFDKSFIANNAAQVKALPDKAKPSPDLFSRNSNPLFGATKDDKTDAKADTKADAKADAKHEKTDSNIPTTKTPVPSIFDKSFIASNAAQAKTLSSSSKPSPDLFSRNSNPLFGAPKGNGTSSADTKSNIDQGEKQVSSTVTSNNKLVETSNDGDKDNTGSVLGLKGPTSTTPAASIFGAPASSKLAAPTSSIFGAPASSKSAAPTASIFATPPSSKSAAPTSSIFATPASSKPAVPTSSIFAAPASSKSAAPTSSIFGEKKADEPTKPPLSIFNSAPAANGSIFGSSSQPSSNSNTQSSSTAFGITATPKLGVSFGAPSSHANGAGPQKLSFEFGSSTPSAGSSSFTFGQNSSSSSGFTFTAGTGEQAASNPFTSSQSNSQLSAPVFGGKSATPKPAASFTFGQQTSSTPKATPSLQGRGMFGHSISSTPKAAPSPQGPGMFGSPGNGLVAPSLSFTQASPNQNPSGLGPSNPSASFSSFGLLQASDGSTVASKPSPRRKLKR